MGDTPGVSDLSYQDSGAGATTQASPPATPAAPSSGSGGGTPQSPSSPAPAATSPAPQTAPEHDNMWQHAMRGMGKALSFQDTKVTKDPTTGAPVVTKVPASPGSVTRRIVAGALAGMAAGFGAQPGPGNAGRAVGAGFAAGSGTAKAANNAQDKAGAEARENYDFQQKALLQKGQQNLLTMQIAEAAFKQSRNQVNAAFEDSSRENQLSDAIKNGGLGSTDLGVFNSFEDVLNAHQSDIPDLPKQVANGNVIVIPHVENGKVNGVRAALVTPEWKTAKLGEDHTFYKMQPGADGQPPKVVGQTVKAGTMNNGEFWTAQQAAEKEILDFQEKQQEFGEKKKLDASEISKNYAEAGKARTEAAAAGGGGDGMPNNPDTLAQMLVSGQIAPSQIGGRMGKGMYNTVIAKASQLAQSQGKTFDATQAESDFVAKKKITDSFIDGKDATAVQSFGTFLGHAKDLADSTAQLRNTNSKLLNMPINKLKDIKGNPALDQTRTRIAAVRTELQNFLNNNHALSEQDKDEGKKLLDENMTPAEFEGQMKQFVHTAGVRAVEQDKKFRRANNDRPAPGLLDEDNEQTLRYLGSGEIADQLKRPAGGARAPQGGMVTVQIPGSPPGQIPAARLQQFLKDHPNAKQGGGGAPAATAPAPAAGGGGLVFGTGNDGVG